MKTTQVQSTPVEAEASVRYVNYTWDNGKMIKNELTSQEQEQARAEAAKWKENGYGRSTGWVNGKSFQQELTQEEIEQRETSLRESNEQQERDRIEAEKRRQAEIAIYKQEELNIESKDYTNFIRCLNSLKDICNDVDIRGGVLRMRSNDKANIIKFDLTPLISDRNILLKDIKHKLNILKPLTKQAIKLGFPKDGAEISFSGSLLFKFVKPALDFMDNKHMTDEEFFKIFNLRDEDLILEFSMNKEQLKSAIDVQRSFNIVSFSMIFNGDKAELKAATTSKDMEATILSNLPTKCDLNCYANLVVTPFIMDKDGEVKFQLYNIQDTVCIVKCTYSIGKVKCDTYCKCQLIEKD